MRQTIAPLIVCKRICASYLLHTGDGANNVRVTKTKVQNKAKKHDESLLIDLTGSSLATAQLKIPV